MKIKSIVTALLAAGTFGSVAVASSERGMSNDTLELSLKAVTKVEKVKAKTSVFSFANSKKKSQQSEYFKQNVHEGTKKYIVRLVGDSAATYKGGIKGFEATNKTAAKSGLNNVEFNPKSAATKKYVAYLDDKQTQFINKASAKLGFGIPELKRFKYAINGFVTELTYAEAIELSKLPEVDFVEQDRLFELETDTGPILIGAPNVWDGTAGGSPYQGEGIVIGILDSGVNTDHPSFAATGADGYTVTNPLGAGTYLGDCVADPSLCNSKLIGVRSYPEITDVYDDPVFGGITRPENGEDYDGHGSHVASTAGGNVLENVPYVVSDILNLPTGDGIPTSYIFDRMSGVAPHANIISYQVCFPGRSGDAHAGCAFTPILSGIDDAIADGVDVINYSIGGTTPFSPWTSSIEIGFLSAQAAGVFVATSAGNSGPSPETTTKVSPWYTSVAAANHGQAGVSGDGKTIGTFTGGDTAAPADITGGGINGSFTGDIVYAGDFINANDPTGDPAQCLEPFPAGTFTATQIVVCDRGDIARVAKAANAAAGGAGGFVLANIQGGADSISQDFYAVPGIHISADDGDALKAWLASGTGHQGTISDATLSRATNTADAIASFSSRGPNQFAEIITPQVAAPGALIYAAYSDDQPFKNVNGGSPSDYAFLSGTSMSSPHVAGAAALVTQAQPTWNPDQIRSALMMTATTAVLKSDGTTPADPWDTGSGRIQVDQAINAGLVMSETEANYLAADPAAGGDPKTLNIPSMANFSCAVTCSWTRTFTAVNAGTYTVSTSSANLTVEPTSFDAVAGESYSVVMTLDVSDESTGEGIFENVFISSSASPDLHLPVFALVNNGSVPTQVDMTAGRNDGSWSVEGIQTVPTSDLNFVVDGLYDMNVVGLDVTVPFDIEQDPTVGAPFDNFDEVFTYPFEVAANSLELRAQISDSTSPDNDLFILFDSDADGVFDTIAGQAATLETNESLLIENPAAGSYLAIVQNYQASSVGASDTGNLTVQVVPVTDPIPGLSVDAPAEADGIVDAKLVWDLEMSPGDMYRADISAYAGENLIGTFPVTLTRVENDGAATTAATLISRGESIDYTLTFRPNVYNQAVDYSVSVDMPEFMSLDGANVVADGGNITVKDPNATGLEIVDTFDIAEDPSNGDYRDDLDQVYVNEFSVPSGTLSLTAAISGSTSPDNDLFIEFDSAGDGSYATLVGFAATAEANEVATVDAPAEGNYRVIVQNWAGSGAATDTGTITITTVPATGEGFIWTFDARAFLPEYTVASADTSATCRNAGLGGFSGLGGYTPLSAYGISTLGVSGDESLWGLFGTSTFNFFGEDKAGMMVSDNGFIMFSGAPGANAWFNLPIPNAAEPNDMIAAMWKDQIVIDEGTRGLRAATLGPLAIVDFDGTQPWNATADSTDRYYYQVQVANDGVSDDHSGLGPYEIIVSWSDTQLGTLSGSTVGVENADGTKGFDVSSMRAEGGQLCFDYNTPPAEFNVTFTVTPQAMYSGQSAAPMITVDSDLTGTSTMMIQAEEVELTNVAPIANAGEDVTYDRADVDEITLDAVNTVDYDTDRLAYRWQQISGETVTIRGGNSLKAYLDVADMANGTYTFQLSVDDGEFNSSDTVTITVTGEEQESSGIGSMGILLLLGIPLLFRRRYTH